MIEIEFKAKDFRGIWWHGYIREIWGNKNRRFTICPSKEFRSDGWVDVQETEIDPQTIERYINQDTIRSRVFTGDLLNGDLLGKEVGIVEYVPKNGSIHVRNLQTGQILPLNAMDFNKMNVIGNRHDHPELMEVGGAS